jgi:hypothetical protein
MSIFTFKLLKTKNIFKPFVAFLVILIGVSSLFASGKSGHQIYGWHEVNDDAAWDARAGLQVVSLRNSFYLMGGRTPIDPTIVPVPGASIIWADVWRSKDKGKSWTKILDSNEEGHWPARAYFQAVTKGKYMYVLGGQDFNVFENPDPSGPPLIPVSQFFNDVWRSRDGVTWQQMTDNADWEGRAGLSSVVFKGEIYVMGGSKNDDSAIIGPEGPQRIYFNDVWKSRDGKEWKQVIKNGPWAPRAGAIAVEKNGYIYIIGGEEGFIGDPPPYFNDVWRSRDGKNWKLVTSNAEWSARPGHQCVVVKDMFVLFGGFGFPNPMDMWISKKGANWKLLENSPWNAVSPAEIKYDFDALVAPGHHGHQPAIYTFGGDRETFDFTDPTNYLNVDNDVWRFSASRKGYHHHYSNPEKESELDNNVDEHSGNISLKNHLNPFNPSTRIEYNLNKSASVSLRIYNITGQHIITLVDQYQEAGSHSIDWHGKDRTGGQLASGVYIYQLNVNGQIFTNTMNLLK